jgi:CBS domain-containing protein
MGAFDVIKLDDPGVRRRFSTRLLRDVRALESMIDREMFEAELRRIGAEQEMVLVDRTFQPARLNLEVLEEVDDRHLTTELGRFNLELNLDPVVFEGTALRQLEDQLHTLLGRVRVEVRRQGGEVVLVGVLPTIRRSDLTLDDMTPVDRYRALNDCLTRLHGGQYQVQVRGPEELIIQHDSMMMEACTTSFQVHMQVAPDRFACVYNIAQAVTGPVLAAASNAPLAFGKHLWKESRIALFQQSVNTRKGTLYQRNMSPRVTFGSQWVEASVFEIFREDISRFRALLGTSTPEDPFAVLDRGGVPELHALQIFNGTVYRWNRPCYGITEGTPHLRIENRVLPSGPTVIDEVANAAFWLGLVEGFAVNEVDVTERMSFEQARTNFIKAAQLGLEARFEWLDGRSVVADELIVEELLPVARRGLTRAAIDPDDIDRYLEVIRERVETRQTGAQWLIDSADKLRDGSRRRNRLNALVSILVERQWDENPGHTWELASRDEITDNWTDFMRVEQCMSTDLLTVGEDEPIELVASIMKWRGIRHLPVEDDNQQITGVVTLRDVVEVLLVRGDHSDASTVSVAEIMTRDPLTIEPATSMLEAIRLMRTHGIGCLPVVSSESRAVGILTERDVMYVTGELMKEEALQQSG